MQGRKAQDGMYMAMSVEQYSEYRRQKTKEGIEYQDFVCEQLHKRGIVLQNMTSQKYQYKRENLLGIEIKYDGKIYEYCDTGRIYIETHEKARPRNGEYAIAGINRDDCWLYGIGDYSVFFIFDKKVLKRIQKHNPNWLYWPKPTDTSKGFCLPVEKARELAARVIEFKEKTTNSL